MSVIQALKPAWYRTILFGLAILLYGNSCWNRYALDDALVITENVYVQQGVKGIPSLLANEGFAGFFKVKKNLVDGGRYRPLSLVTFAVEHQFFGNNPHISHGINTLLFALLSLLLYGCFQRVLCVLGHVEASHGMAFWAALLFTVHPVHTEVVANIKGRDELLSVLFLCASFKVLIGEVTPLKWWRLALSAFLFFLALLSKEHAVMLVPLLAVVFMMQQERRPVRTTMVQIGALALVLAGYLYLRGKALGGVQAGALPELMNDPYLWAAHGEKLPTVVYILWRYLKLLLLPHPLTYDYYPFHIPYQSWSSFGVWLSMGIYVALVGFLLWSIRKHRVVGFGLAWYLITLLPMTNLLVNIGSFMNERFLFLPSAGAMLALAYGVWQFLKWRRKTVVAVVLGVVIVVFSCKTFIRNMQWKDNYTLFTHDVRVSEGSAKANCTAGGALYERALATTIPNERDSLFRQSLHYLNCAVAIYPEYVDALLLLGNVYYEYQRDISSAGRCYRKILERSPGYELAFSNYKKVAMRHNQPLEKRDGLRYLYALQPTDFDLNYELGITYGKILGNNDSALVYLRKAVDLRPGSHSALRDLGVAYALGGQYSASLPCFVRADSLQPNNRENLINLGMTYHNLGETRLAMDCFKRAEMLDKPVK